jgi:hypothetical protein
MATTVSLVSSVLMGTVLVGLAALLSSGKSWRRYKPAALRREQGQRPDDLGLFAAGFLLATLLIAGATLSVLSGGQLWVVLGLIGAALLAFLAAGIYVAGRSHGHPRSHAVGEAVLVVGAIGLLTVVGWLIAAPWS